MSGDDATLVEPLESDLLRAGFDEGAVSAVLLNEHASSPLVRRRVLALRGLSRRGLLTSSQWRTALGDDEAEVRRETLLLLARTTKVEPVLLARVLTLLEDEDVLVVEAAAFAAGESNYGPAVSALCRVATEHEDARCREAAVAALGSLGDELGLATILASLQDRAPIRRRAIVALSNFEGPEVEAALAAASEDRDWQVRDAVGQLRADD